MKRLIVLTALVTLLGTLPGCSIVNGKRAERTCGTPWVTQRKAMKFSMPWRRQKDDCGVCGQPVTVEQPVCNACNGAMVTTSPIVTAPLVSEYDSATVYEGETVYPEASAIPTAPLEP